MGGVIASEKVIQGLTLAILALVAIALLKGRKLSHEIRTSLSVNAPGASAREFFWKRHDVEKVKEYILAAKTEVWLWGTTLSMHVGELRPTIEEAIEQGVTIRVLLVPSAPIDALSMAAWRAGHSDTEELEHELSTNLARLKRVAEKFENSERTGRLEVRTLNYWRPMSCTGTTLSILRECSKFDSPEFVFGTPSAQASRCVPTPMGIGTPALCSK